MRSEQKERKLSKELRFNLTPMIDIIFQLLIFFVLTAKFIAFEGQLQAYLPKDRGLDATNPVLSNNVTLFLEWDEAGKVTCLTTQYHMDGVARQVYPFPQDPNATKVPGGWITDTIVGTGAKAGKVTYDYAAPDFVEVDRYLKYRRDAYQQTGTASKGLPVEINFSNKVPWQAVVNIIDICKRLNIVDISLSAEELEF